MSIQAELIERSGAAIQTLGIQVTDYFYHHLFTHYPEVRRMFPADMTAQKLRLFQALVRIVSNIRNTEVLAPYLKNLGIGHIQYGTRPEHYSLVGKSLLATLKHFLGPEWTEEMAGSWIEAYNLAASLCIEASFEAMQPDRYVALKLEDAPPILAGS